MTPQAIRVFLDRPHFAPVHFITDTGERLLVPHPDFVTFSPTGRTCLIYAEDGESFETVDVLTITDVAPVKRGGAKKKKS